MANETSATKPVMYIFLNKGLGMSAGKLASQAAHAAVEAYLLSDKELIKDWRLGLHYTKLVMQARDAEHIGTIQEYLKERGFVSTAIIDEGLTEIEPHVVTALGVEIVDKSDPNVAATFSTFELFRDSIRLRLEIDR